MDGEGLTELMNAEDVTIYAGVPTVHVGLLNYWEESGQGVPSLRIATSGGAASTRTMVARVWEKGIEIRQGWGMTETSPIGSISYLTEAQKKLGEEEKFEIALKQGAPPFGVELRIIGEDGQRLPDDGEAVGELQIRGPWVASAYLGEEPGSRLDKDGWFSTGDVARILPNGTIHLTDRVKDLIKSGGEWISSIDLEDMATRHPEIAMAAVIATPHEKWGERPLLIAVPAPDSSPTKESVLEFLEGQVAKWWLPDDVVFVDELPLGATGKVQKSKLREQYAS
jgi:3-(methylthio)propionyl---CoA ligase